MCDSTDCQGGFWCPHGFDPPVPPGPPAPPLVPGHLGQPSYAECASLAVIVGLCDQFCWPIPATISPGFVNRLREWVKREVERGNIAKLVAAVSDTSAAMSPPDDDGEDLTNFDPTKEGGGGPCLACGLRFDPWVYSRYCQACIWDGKADADAASRTLAMPKKQGSGPGA